MESSLDLTEEDKLTVRMRLNPMPGDLEYLIVSDLLLAVREVATDAPIKLLDYGADLSPYKSLFPNSEYKCADIGGRGAVDYLLDEDGSVPEIDESFDLVLSTQVAEHLEDPAKYFSECYRLLKPGGRLFLSTHGSYEDHAFPNDYQRWTSDGLRRDLETAGFDVDYVNKLSAGPRAAVYQIERCLELSFMPRNTIPGMIIWTGRHFVRFSRKFIHRLADRWFSDYRIVAGEDWNHRIYICLAVLATRAE